MPAAPSSSASVFGAGAGCAAAGRIVETVLLNPGAPEMVLTRKVQRTPHTNARLAHHMRVNHRCIQLHVGREVWLWDWESPSISRGRISVSGPAASHARQVVDVQNSCSLLTHCNKALLSVRDWLNVLKRSAQICAVAGRPNRR